MIDENHIKAHHYSCVLCCKMINQKLELQKVPQLKDIFDCVYMIMLVRFIVTEATKLDSKFTLEIIERIKAEYVLADRIYDSDTIV